LVTVYGGTDYTLANASISSPFYSHDKNPFGFPSSPAKWTVEVTDSSTRLFTATKDTWAVPTGSTATISLPIGAWYVSYRVVSRGTVSGGTPSFVSTYTTLSTTTNSETDSNATSMTEIAPGGSAVVNVNNTHALSTKLYVMSSKTTHNLLHKMNTDGTASGATSGFNGAANIKAVCAYL